MKKKYLFIIALLVSSIFSYGQCTVPDETKPSISCIGNQIKSADAGKCYYTTVGTEFNPTASDDNCVVISVTNDFNSTSTLDGAQIPNGTTITWTVTDAAGLQTSCSFTVTVIDNQAPAVTCPANISVNNTPGTCGAVVTYTAPVGTDNCTGATTAQTAGLASGATFPVGTTTNTFRVTDTAGLQTSCSFTVTVLDNQVPVITCPIATSTNKNANTGVCTYTVVGAEFNATATDNCAVTSLTYTLSGVTSGTGTTLAGVVFNKGITTVTWSATDGITTAATCSFTVTVLDNQVPAITCPIATSTNKNANTGVCTYTVVGAEFNATATDNCAVTSLTYALSGVTSGTGTTLAGVLFNKGITTVTWSATDGITTAATCSFTVTVLDNQVPVITCPIATSTNKNANTGVCTYIVVGAEFNATATDNCAVTSLTYTLSGVTSGTGTTLAGVVFNKGITTVTWSATDGITTAATCSFTVTVLDNQVPVITCPIATSTNKNANTGVCTYTVVGAEFNATATDNCAVTSLTYALSGVTSGTGTTLAGVLFNKGITTVTWSATDGITTAATCSFTVTVLDNQVPAITCPIATSTNKNANTGVCTYTVVSAEFNATATDNCAVTSLTYTLSGVTSGTGTTLAGVVFNKGITTVTWSATDGITTAATCSFTVTVLDNQVPAITCPIATSTNKNANTGVCTYTVVGAEFNATATDNCAVTSLTYTLSGVTSGTGTTLAGVVFNKGITTVTWSATDGITTAATCSFTVTVLDNQVPAITCPIATSKNANTGVCTYTVVGAEFNATATDNCAVTSLTYALSGVTSGTGTTLAGVLFNKGITTVTWSATDGITTDATCSFTVTVLDNQVPVITCPIATSTNKNANTGVCTYTVVGAEFNATATDNCAVTSLTYALSGVTSGTGTTLAGVLFNKGITTVTWSATDGITTAATCSFTVTVLDNQVPVITCPIATSTNKNANTGVCTYTVVGAEFNATATDNCAVTSLTYTLSGVTSGTGTTLAGVLFNKGITTVTWSATDGITTAATCSFTVTVLDNQVPAITCPIATSTNKNANTGVCTYTVVGAEFNATATDNCAVTSLTYALSGVTSGTGTTLAGVLFNKGITTVTWSATDGITTAATCSFTVTVLDNQVPVITCPIATSTNKNANTGVCTYTVVGAEFNATATDNCAVTSLTYALSGVTSGTGTTLAGVLFNKGITTVTWSATDGITTDATCSFTVTVLDNQVPVITCPIATSTNKNANTGVCTYTVVGAEFNATATDNCAVTSLTYALSGVTSGTGTTLAGVLFNKGITTVTWSATDGITTDATCSFTVTVLDNQVPVITCPIATSTNKNANTGVCTYTVVGAEFNATATDNCAVTSLTYALSGVTSGTGTTLAGVLFNKGITTVTWSATDGITTDATCSFTVTVLDNQVPVITCPIATSTNKNANTGVCTYTVVGAEFNATATDNCAVTSLTYALSGVTSGTGTTLAGVLFNKGITTVTWSATDGITTAATCSFTVTVLDNQVPVITCPIATSTNKNANTGVCTYTVVGAEFNATATDNCAVTSLTYALSGVTSGTGTTLAGVLFNKGITTVTWSATDGITTAATCSFTVTVLDNQVPAITCPIATSTNKNANTGVCTYTVVGAEFNATATDNCAVTSLTYALSGVTSGTGTTLAGVLFNKGITTVTWSATDGITTAATCSFTVTVLDNQVPVITCPTNLTPNVGAGTCTASVATANPVTADNCSVTKLTWALTGATTANSAATGINNLGTQVFNLGTTTVTYTVSDAAGNTTNCSYTVIVTDNINPTLTIVSGFTENLSTACSFVIPNYTGLTTAADNCTAEGSINKTQSPAIGTVISGHNSTQLITITANDGNGNTNTTTFTITLKDVTKPIITCPGTATANTNSDGTGNCTTTVSLGTPTATDNCTTTGSFTFIAKVGGTTINPVTYLFGKGTSTVVWTAIDQAGNISASCNQTVIVTDNENPIITSCPGNKTANTSANGTGDCTTTVNLGSPTATDNCGTISITAKIGSTIIDPATHLFVIGTTTVTWVATDNSGLTATCNQIVEIIDNENPTISCPSDQNVFFNTNCGFTLLDYTTFASTSDNCDNNLTITQSPAPGTIITGITTVTLTAKDYSNRTSSCTFKVIPTDKIKPVAVCKNYTAYLTANGTVTVAASNLNNGSSDNCGIVNMTISPNSFNCADIGTKTVTFTVYDNGGNSDSCQAEITIVDNTPPTMLCKNFVVVVDAITRVATIKASDVDNGTNDACGIASLSVSPSEFPESANVYTTTTVLTAVDIHGNSNTCTATITVEPPKNQFTYLTGQIINPVPDNQQPPAALIEATACPGGITVPKDVHFTIQAIGSYDLQASDIENWEYSNDNGETWIVLSGTAGLLEYTLTGLLSDTFVRLRIRDSVDPTLIKTSAEAYVRFLPPDERPIIISHTALDICLGDSVTVIAESFFDQPNGQFGEGGEFNYAQPDGWRVNKRDGFFPASGDNGNEESWKETNSNNNATFSGINYDTTDNTKFAVAHGVGNTSALGNYTSLETPVFSTIGMTASEAILNFKTSYYFCNGGYGEIWLSFDSGNTYTVQLSTNEPFDFDSRDGVTTTGVKLAKGPGNNCIGRTDPRMMPATVSLGAYAGLSGLRVMFKFTGSTSSCGTVSSSNIPNPDNVNCGTGNALASGWAIDAVGFNFAGVDDELEWTDENGTVIARGTTAIVTPVTPGVREYGVTTLVNGCRTNNNDGTNFININTSLAYAGEDYMPLTSNCGDNTLKLNAYDNRITAVENYDKGAWKSNLYVVPNITMGNINYKGTGVTGAWSIISSSSSSCGSSATFSSTTDPNAIFTADPGSYSLRWTLINGCYDDVNVTVIDCKTVDFDGVNDFVTFKNNYNLNNDFSIEVWVKPNSVSNTSTVFSRKNAANNTTGYDLSIVNGQVKFNWYNGSGSGSVTSGAYTINTSRWYHLAVTFNGSTYKLYVDGLELGSVNGTAPALTAINVEAILGAMYQVSPSVPTNYFNGWVDELEIWSKALSVENIRQMMNQEIVALGPDVGGVVIPTKIYGADSDLDGAEDVELVWNDLIGYYRMNVVCGDLSAYKGVSGRLRNINSSEQQTAPIPYTTRVNDQTWDTDNTWTNFNVWDVPNSLGINTKPIDWNIVVTSHKVTSDTRDITLLGLIVMSNELIITNSGVQDENNSGHLLWLTKYLKLDGKIDLIGESQLLQKRHGYYDTPGGNFITSQFNESVFENSSTGYIERDQQGKQNSYNYNYWSSPVSKRGGANNSNYTVSDVLRGGTVSSSPKIINFGDGAYFADGDFISPIKISNRWIWSYKSLTPDSNSDWDNYYQWQYKANTGLIGVAEGFTMKGTGGVYSVEKLQNYVFTGKPNSGTISLFLAIYQTYLVGNPYPSALDANEFIKDNIKDCFDCRGSQNSFGGALYFWDHFGLSNSHILAEYEGGYATYTLTGGVPGINDSSLTLNDGTSGVKTPGRYIPVGQGFFIDGDLDLEVSGTGVTTTVGGGTITFKNSQRIFVRETGSPVNSIFMKKNSAKSSLSEDQGTENDFRLKIRLGFDSTVGAHRQLLLGADSNTTNKFDLGYDAQMFDTNDNDMYWELGDIQLVIQSVQNFNDDQIIPFGLSVANEGKSIIKIDALENIPNTLEIYLHDNVTGIYHDIKNNDYPISLPIGEYNNRFSLQFVNKLYNVGKTALDDGIYVYYTNNNEMLNIKNNFIDTTVEKVYLFNVLGQNLANWDIDDIKQNNIQIPIKNVSTGVYIVKLKTTKGELSSKILIP